MIRKIILITILAIAAGCQSAGTPAQPTSNLQAEPSANPTAGGAAMAIQITSPSFAEGQIIPKKYTCDDRDVSPQLDWKGAPPGTQSLALIVDDPDAPSKTWVHWVLFNIPADTNSLPEGVTGIGVQGKNDSSKLGYGGPCPPRGSAHRYFFKLYALDNSLSLAEGARKAEVEQAMQNHILGQGQLMGKYSR